MPEPRAHPQRMRALPERTSAGSGKGHETVTDVRAAGELLSHPDGQLTHSLTCAMVAAGSSVAGVTDRLVTPASRNASIRSLT